MNDVPAMKTRKPELPVVDPSILTVPEIEPVAVSWRLSIVEVSASLTTTFAETAFSKESFEDA